MPLKPTRTDFGIIPVESRKLRRLQQFTVNLPRQLFDTLVTSEMVVFIDFETATSNFVPRAFCHLGTAEWRKQFSSGN